MPRPRRLVALVALLAGLATAGAPGTAGADPARPTDYRSRVLTVAPALPTGVTVAVVGGDAFLEVRAARGRTVTVLDYEQGRDQAVGPYLRFRADGVVERNEASLAAAVNGSRYGSSPGGAPSPGRAGTEPRWRQVAADGRYAWHDHRIHWMLRQPPSVVDRRGRVDLGGPNGTWTVPLVVDGEPHTVRGELVLLEAPSPWPWAAVAGIAGLGLAGAAVLWRRRGRPVPHLALALALAVVGGLASAVALVAWRSPPPGTGPGPASALVALAGTVAAGLAAAALLAGRSRVARIALAAAVAALGSWAWLRRDVLTHAVLPTDLPQGLDRAATALALGAAVGAAAVLVWRPPVPARPSPAP